MVSEEEKKFKERNAKNIEQMYFQGFVPDLVVDLTFLKRKPVRDAEEALRYVVRVNRIIAKKLGVPLKQLVKGGKQKHGSEHFHNFVLSTGRVTKRKLALVYEREWKRRIGYDEIKDSGQIVCWIKTRDEYIEHYRQKNNDLASTDEQVMANRMNYNVSGHWDRGVIFAHKSWKQKDSRCVKNTCDCKRLLGHHSNKNRKLVSAIGI